MLSKYVRLINNLNLNYSKRFNLNRFNINRILSKELEYDCIFQRKSKRKIPYYEKYETIDFTPKEVKTKRDDS